MWINNGFSVSTNKDYLDVSLIHSFLSKEAYWSKGIPNQTVKKAIENSPFCFGVYKGEVGKDVFEQKDILMNEMMKNLVYSLRVLAEKAYEYR